MEALISFLPMLVCPIMLGLLVWMMNRQEMQQDEVMQPQESLWSELRHLAACCVNPFVVAALVLVGMGLYWVSSEMPWRFAPTLLILICPLSMLLTMCNMNRQEHQTRLNRESKENRKLS